LVPAFDDRGKGFAVRFLFRRGQAAPLGKNLEKGKTDGLALDCFGRRCGRLRLSGVLL